MVSGQHLHGPLHTFLIKPLLINSSCNGTGSHNYDYGGTCRRISPSVAGPGGNAEASRGCRGRGRVERSPAHIEIQMDVR